MIVGNKCDEESNREVKKELASKVVSESMKDSGHMETSAKLNLNVQPAFQVSFVPSAPSSVSRNNAQGSGLTARLIFPTRFYNRNFYPWTKRELCRSSWI